MRAGISESTRPAAAKEPDRPQIINNRPLAVSLPRPDEFLRLTVFYTEVRGALNVTVVFETSIVDRVRVTEALRLLATDPLGFFPGPPALAPG
jgi:hypothetical protein